MQRLEWYREVNRWERDVRNRQRNIVFPDTMLNEGRFYRHMFSDKASFAPLQRFGIVALAVQWLAVGSLAIALELGALTGLRGIDQAFTAIFLIPPLALVGFGILVGIRAVAAPSEPRPRYRSSYRGPGKPHTR